MKNGTPHDLSCWRQKASNELTEQAALVNASSFFIFAPMFSELIYMFFFIEVTTSHKEYSTPGIDVTIPHNVVKIRQLQLVLASTVFQGHTCVAMPLKSVV